MGRGVVATFFKNKVDNECAIRLPAWWKSKIAPYVIDTEGGVRIATHEEMLPPVIRKGSESLSPSSSSSQKAETSTK